MRTEDVAAHQDDVELVSRCLSGEVKALTSLRGQYHQQLIATTINRGAMVTEAEDLIADLWGDLTARSGEKPPLLEKYHGRCPLSAWLTSVATNRLIDRRRRQRHHAEMPSEIIEGQIAAPAQTHGEVDLYGILRQAVAEAFAACEPEALVMLKLVYIYGVKQCDIARVWGWHESKVSRRLATALTTLQTHILSRVKQTDELLSVNWEDVLAMCQTGTDFLS